MATEIPANGWKATYYDTTKRGSALFDVTDPCGKAWDVMVTPSDQWVFMGESDESPTPDESEAIKNAVLRFLIQMVRG